VLDTDVASNTSGDGFTILVLINQPLTHATDVTLPGGSALELLRKPGDVCFLPPRTAINLRAGSQAAVVQYGTTESSLKAFAERAALDDKYSLVAPLAGTDTFLLVASRTVRPLLLEPASFTAEFGRIFAFSFYRHLLGRYGTKASAQGRFVGGLSPQHRRIVEEELETSAGTILSIDTLAERCGLSSRHFARAFRQGFGVPFYRHLMNLRLEQAKRLLLESNRSLKDIATEIGYSDQATFTESFTAAVGSSPGRYRRRYGEGGYGGR
jgi:AraC-like DNA-binding protein